MNNISGVIIFSVKDSDIESVRTYLALNKIKYRDVLGTYNGVKEQSIKVADRFETVVLSIAAQYNQECILYVDRKGSAYLRYMKDLSIKQLGSLVQISPLAARSLDCTFDYETETYWTTTLNNRK